MQQSEGPEVEQHKPAPQVGDREVAIGVEPAAAGQFRGTDAERWVHAPSLSGDRRRNETWTQACISTRRGTEREPTTPPEDGMATETGRDKDEARKKAEQADSDDEGTPEETPTHGTPEGGPSPTLPPNPVAEPGNPGGSPA